MSDENTTATISVEELPFIIEKKDNYVEISTKPRKGHMSKKMKDDFDKEKVIVKLILFDAEVINRLSKIALEEYKGQSSFFSFLQNIKRKLTGGEVTIK